MDINEAYANLGKFRNTHSKQWKPSYAPYKVAATIDFGSDYYQKTDIDSEQIAADLSVMVIFEEKFRPYSEFTDEKSLAVQKRQLEIADKAKVPAFLILTSRQNSDAIVCGDPATGLDWNLYLDTISTLYKSGDLSSAKIALGNGIADIYSKSNVIAIIPNQSAIDHNYKNERIKWNLLHYKEANVHWTVDTFDKFIKLEFSAL